MAAVSKSSDPLVVVTGAAGFVGNVLVRRLISRGIRVRAMVHHMDKGERVLAGLDCEIVQGDVRDPKSLEAAFDGAAQVYHLASVISLAGDLGGRLTATNVQGAENVARAALAGGARLLHCSSCHAFNLDEEGPEINESTSPSGAGRPIYDRTKAAGEARVRAVIGEGQLDGVIANPTGVIGPYDHTPSRMGKMLLLSESGGMPVMVQGGFNFVDVRDIADGLIAVMERGRRGEGYLLGGEWVNMMQVTEYIGCPKPWFAVPLWVARLVAPIMDLLSWCKGSETVFTSDSLVAIKLPKSRPISDAKARKELGYSPMSVHESVYDAMEWFKEHKMVKNPNLQPPKPKNRV